MTPITKAGKTPTTNQIKLDISKLNELKDITARAWKAKSSKPSSPHQPTAKAIDTSKDLVAATIMSTMDYERFEVLFYNRKIDWNAVAEIKKKMLKNDLSMYMPVIVDPNFSKIDGQHHFFASKDLGRPIYYVIKKDFVPEDVADFQGGKKCWHMKERCHFYGALGNDNYLKVAEFAEVNKINYEAALAITTQKYCSIKAFVDGFYVFDNPHKAEEIMKIVSVLADCNGFGKKARYGRCIGGIEKIYSLSGFKSSHFLKKLESFPSMVKCQLKKTEYAKMFADIYNKYTAKPEQVKYNERG